jgi:hypothetical protein
MLLTTSGPGRAVVEKIYRDCPTAQMAKQELNAFFQSVEAELLSRYSDLYERRDVDSDSCGTTQASA